MPNCASASVVAGGATAADTSNSGGALTGQSTLSVEASPPLVSLRFIIKT